MKITVSVADVLPPEFVLCDVNWIAPSGEQMTARVRLKADIGSLPRPAPVGGVKGLLEPIHLPPALQVEAVSRARILANQFYNREV
jgi:hypothetical protein